ncbi:MAG TPA: RcnB family protein [Rhizomicrobium sp.]
MKRLIAIATALCFTLPAIALAAPPDRNRPGGPMTKPAVGQQPAGGRPNKPGGGNGKPDKPNRPGGNGHRPPPRPNPPGNGHKPRPPGNGNKPRPPGNGWHKPRPNQWYWRGSWINRIHAALFRYPTGYSYRHWNVGDRLPSVFLASQYYYDNVVPLGLAAPPPGYRWVRYGPDLLLVNLRTGSVEEVAYGTFY